MQPAGEKGFRIKFALTSNCNKVKIETILTCTFGNITQFCKHIYHIMEFILLYIGKICLIIEHFSLLELILCYLDLKIFRVGIVSYLLTKSFESLLYEASLTSVDVFI